MDNPQIKRAIISVTDKTGVAAFAKALEDEFGVEIVSTGGTAKALEEAGVTVKPIDELTGFISTPLIRLQRIYIFLLFHAIIYDVLDVQWALKCTFILCLGLTY